MDEEPYEHRPINRGCGKEHSGYRDDCDRCREVRDHDEEQVRKWREEQKRVQDEKTKKD